MLRSVYILVFLIGFSSPALADNEAALLLPGAKVVGTGSMRYAFWNIYDATLYAPEGKFTEQKPFVLSLRYMRELDGKDIADRSVEEMRKQGFQDEIRLAAWNAQMKDIFPDVQDGTVLSALFIPGGRTVFYQGSSKIGVIDDPEFTQRFSDIWLGKSTSEPSLRRKLLGAS